MLWDRVLLTLRNPFASPRFLFCSCEPNFYSVVYLGSLCGDSSLEAGIGAVLVRLATSRMTFRACELATLKLPMFLTFTEVTVLMGVEIFANIFPCKEG